MRPPRVVRQKWWQLWRPEVRLASFALTSADVRAWKAAKRQGKRHAREMRQERRADIR